MSKNNNPDNIVVVAVDVGNVKEGRFGWDVYPPSSHFIKEALKKSGGKKDDIESLANFLNALLEIDKKVPIALGFEAPLFIPMDDESIPSTRKRYFDYNRPWSAGGGAYALAVGLKEAAWIFKKIKSKNRSFALYFNFEKFLSASPPKVLIWEAFVVNDLPAEHDLCKKMLGKSECEFNLHGKNEHVCDAFKAAFTFYHYITNKKPLNDDKDNSQVDPQKIFEHYSYDEKKKKPKCFNLAGAALLWSGLLDEEIKKGNWKDVQKRYLYTPCLVIKTAKP